MLSEEPTKATRQPAVDVLQGRRARAALPARIRSTRSSSSCSSIMQRVRKASPDEDDLLTLLWEAEFVFLRYRYVDLDARAGAGARRRASGSASDDERGRSTGRSEEPPARAGVVNMADFDSTLYFLDEQEIEYLQARSIASTRRPAAERRRDPARHLRAADGHRGARRGERAARRPDGAHAVGQAVPERGLSAARERSWPRSRAPEITPAQTRAAGAAPGAAERSGGAGAAAAVAGRARRRCRPQTTCSSCSSSCADRRWRRCSPGSPRCRTRSCVRCSSSRGALASQNTAELVR